MVLATDTSSTSQTSTTQPWGSVFANKMLVIPWNADNGWKQPTIRPSSLIPLHPACSVLHYGTSVFEGMKVFNTSTGPCVFRPDLHVRRLADSAARIALPIPPEPFLPTLLSYVRSVRESTPATPPDSLYLRVTVIATSQQLGGRPPKSALLFAIASPVGSFFPRPADALQTGLRLYADVRHTRASPGGVGFCKTGGNYAASLGPLRDATENGFDQVLWLSDLQTRKISEVGVMNIFFVMRELNADGTGDETVLVTPEVDGSFLNGVTRRSVLELGHEVGFQTLERSITIDDVFKAAREGRLVDAFGTGTAAAVCPIGSIECDGEKVFIREVERENDPSVILRKKLLGIQADGGHKWMTSIEDCDVLATAKSKVEESEIAITPACIGL